MMHLRKYWCENKSGAALPQKNGDSMRALNGLRSVVNFSSVVSIQDMRIKVTSYMFHVA